MKKTIKIKESDLKNMIHKVLKEQSLPGHIKKGSKEHADWVRSHQRDGSDELLEKLLVGAQRLARFVEDTRRNGSRDDLKDIQEVIDNNISQYIETTEGINE
jgi:hypothetical protein